MSWESFLAGVVAGLLVAGGWGLFRSWRAASRAVRVWERECAEEHDSEWSLPPGYTGGYTYVRGPVRGRDHE